MQNKYAKDGLVVITVSLDSLEQKDVALAFLRGQQATFPNFLLNEESEVWQDKFKMRGPPVAYIFDRAGKRAARFDTEDPDNKYSHENVEKIVQELLRAKP